MNDTWTYRPLGELFEIGAGKTMSAAARAGTNKTPFLRTSNVLWDQIDLSQVDEMAIPERELHAKLLLPGDLLVCEGGEIGRAAIWNGEIETVSFQNHLHRLRSLDENVEPHFYVYFLQSAFTQLGIFEGAGNKTTIPNLSRSRLAALSIPQPPLEEQQAIAMALAHVRKAMRSHEQIARVANDLKRSTMQELFTRGLRGEAQKETEIGPMPESWNLTPCEQIFKLTSGKKRPSNLSDSPSEAKPFPVLGGNGVMGFSDEWYLDRSQVLIIGRVGEYCGAIHFASGKFWVTDNALYAKEWRNNSANLAFVGLFLEHFDLNRFKRMAGQPLVTQGMINEHRIPLPRTLDEQKEIVAILDAIERKIDLHRRKRAVLDELFKALLHKLMTGEISVTDFDFSPFVPRTFEQGIRKEFDR
ncbi:MAG: restriction endonuclease subunit S [Caldilineaceae bacterium]|nr:restriction endonuclease subunit S [Caldilineaceae bacterium]